MELLDIFVSIGSIAAFAGIVITAVVRGFKTVIKPMNERIDRMDEIQCKTFLVSFLNDVENGTVEDEIEYQLAYDIYDHYTNELNKNSYIHDK